jgi:hypothetical protein
MLFPFEERDFKRLRHRYFKETSPAVKKTILALFVKAPGQLKTSMFAETIQEPQEEINRFRKYIWALTYSPALAQASLAVLSGHERDPARLLVSLHGALQSRNSETLKQVQQIADQRLQVVAISELARRAFEQVSTDAKRMAEDLAKAKK